MLLAKTRLFHALQYTHRHTLINKSSHVNKAIHFNSSFLPLHFKDAAVNLASNDTFSLSSPKAVWPEEYDILSYVNCLAVVIWAVSFFCLQLNRLVWSLLGCQPGALCYTQRLSPAMKIVIKCSSLALTQSPTHSDPLWQEVAVPVTHSCGHCGHADSSRSIRRAGEATWPVGIIPLYHSSTVPTPPVRSLDLSSCMGSGPGTQCSPKVLLM